MRGGWPWSNVDFFSPNQPRFSMVKRSAGAAIFDVRAGTLGKKPHAHVSVLAEYLGPMEDMGESLGLSISPQTCFCSMSLERMV